MSRSIIIAAVIFASGCLVTNAGAEIPSERSLRPADVKDDGTSELLRINEFLAGGQWDEAVETLRRVMQEKGDQRMLLPIAAAQTDRDFLRYATVRHVCQLQLVNWHRAYPDALELYRRRVDPLARRWYEDATAQRDERLLERIVEELFASSYGDDALYRLGEFSLERGQYEAARQHWEQISPLLRVPANGDSGLAVPPASPWWVALRGIDLDAQWTELEPMFTRKNAPLTWLAYPDTDLKLSDVRARLMLASMLEGSPERAGLELELLRRLHPEERGRIGGQEGKYVDLLTALQDESQRWPTPLDGKHWPTFAGTSARNGGAQRGVDIAMRPLWSVDLPRLIAPDERIGYARSRIGENADGLLSYHPIVVGDLVLWNEPGEAIKAHKLHQDEAAWPGAGREQHWQIYPSTPRASAATRVGNFFPRDFVGVPRYTLSADGRRLFARLGPPLTSSREEDDDRETQRRSELVGVDLSKQGRLMPGFPIEPDGVRWEFEGSPISDGSRIYVAMRYSTARSDEAALHVACYDLRSVPSETAARPRWRTEVCEANTVAGGVWDEITHTLVSLDEGTIFCNTNLGVVAALDSRDGSVKWLTRFPRRPLRPVDPDANDSHFFRDLNPCVCYKDLIIAAPKDCDLVFALDRATGQLLWQRSLPDVVHLLGVGADNLIAGGASLYWIDVYSGANVGQFPQPQGVALRGLANANPSGNGRGILAGDHVYWPTRERIYVFEQQTDRQQTPDGRVAYEPRGVRTIDLQPRGVTGGNLVIADGVLLIATADKLVAFGETANALTENGR